MTCKVDRTIPMPDRIEPTGNLIHPDQHRILFISSGQNPVAACVLGFIQQLVRAFQRVLEA